jgi:hypothetical protein
VPVVLDTIFAVNCLPLPRKSTFSVPEVKLVDFVTVLVSLGYRKNSKSKFNVPLWFCISGISLEIKEKSSPCPI